MQSNDIDECIRDSNSRDSRTAWKAAPTNDDAASLQERKTSTQATTNLKDHDVNRKHKKTRGSSGQHSTSRSAYPEEKERVSSQEASDEVSAITDDDSGFGACGIANDRISFTQRRKLLERRIEKLANKAMFGVRGRASRTGTDAKKSAKEQGKAVFASAGERVFPSPPQPLAYDGVEREDTEAAAATAGANGRSRRAHGWWRLPRAAPIRPTETPPREVATLRQEQLDDMTLALPGDNDANITLVDKRSRYHLAPFFCLGVLALAAVALVIVLPFVVPGIFGVGGEKDEAEQNINDTSIRSSPSVAPTTWSFFSEKNNNGTDTAVAESFYKFFSTLSDPQTLRNESSPQYAAYHQLVNSYAATGIRKDDWERLQQRYVMFVLYYGAGGLEFDKRVHLFRPEDHECDMHLMALNLGVFCDVREQDGFRFITAVRLGVNLLVGELQNEVFLLPYLRVFDFSSNFLSGTIPSTFGLLKFLEELRLGRNYLSGTIPSELGRIYTLQVLSLSANALLTGTIPTTFGQLRNLRILDLSRNNGITGHLPLELSYLSSLDYLFLQNTSLHGSLEMMCDAGEESRQPSSYYGFLSDCSSPSPNSDNFMWIGKQEVECSCCTGCYGDWYGAATSKGEPLICPLNETKVEVTVNTDGNGHETTWNLTVGGEITVAMGGPYFSDTISNRRLCVPDNRCYSWAIYDEGHDAMCCRNGKGSFSLKVNDVELARGDRPTSVPFGFCKRG